MTARAHRGRTRRREVWPAEDDWPAALAAGVAETDALTRRVAALESLTASLLWLRLRDRGCSCPEKDGQP